MCCLFVILLFLGPRIAGILWWLFEPLRWQFTFDNILWPILGLIFLPWTTLMYVIVFPVDGVQGFEWLLIALAFVADIASYTGGGYTNRNRIPGYAGSPEKDL